MKLAKHIVWLGLAVALAFGGRASAEPLKLRIQWPSAPGNTTVFMPHAPKGLLKHYGKSYIVEPIFMRGSTPAMQALAAGGLEIATFTPSALAIAVTQAKLDVHAFAQMLTTGYPGYAAPGFWVHKDEIKSAADVKGKIVAVNAHGSAIDAGQKLYFKRHGLIVGRDYQTVEVRIPAMLAALQSHRVAVAFLLRPFDLRAAKDPNLTRLFKMSDALGSDETGMWVGKADWIAAHRAALVDLVEDNIRLRRWLADPKSRPEAMAMVAKVMKQPVKNISGWAFTKRDTSHQDPDAKIDVKRLQRNVDDLIEAGLLTEKVDAAKYVELFDRGRGRRAGEVVGRTVRRFPTCRTGARSL